MLKTERIYAGSRAAAALVESWAVAGGVAKSVETLLRVYVRGVCVTDRLSASVLHVSLYVLSASFSRDLSWERALLALFLSDA